MIGTDTRAGQVGGQAGTVTRISVPETRRNFQRNRLNLCPMRLMTFIVFAAIALGLVGYFAGQHFGLAKAVPLGIFLVGAGLAVAGIESLYTRRMSMRFSPDAAQNYAGFPALVWGAMLLAVGVATIGYAYVVDTQWARLVVTLQKYYGAKYLAAGILLSGCSVLAFVDPGGRLHWWESLLLRFPRVVLGSVLLVSSLLVTGAGAWQLLDPPGFAPLEREIFSKAGIVLKAAGLPDSFEPSKGVKSE